MSRSVKIVSRMLGNYMVSRPSVFFKNIENFNLENTSSVDNKFEYSVLVTSNAPSNDA